MVHKGLLFTFTALAALFSLTAPVQAQTRYRMANLIGTTNPNEGRCTVSVFVDGATNVEIRGDTATLLNVSGQPAHWQRFECTAPIPNSVSNLGIRAIEGNGTMTLVHDAENGGVALVKVRSNDVGEHLYSFDVFWNPSRTYRSNEADRAMVDDDAVQSCRSSVESRIRGDGYRYVHFGSITTDGHGPDDWVTGTATGDRDRTPDTFNFSCRINAQNGQLQRVDVERQ